MLHTFLSAVVILVLVLVGMPFLITVILPMEKAEIQKERKPFNMRKIWKLVEIIWFLLGLAFLGGAVLAHLQGVIAQVSILTTVGVVCLIAALICFLMRTYRK